MAEVRVHLHNSPDEHLVELVTDDHAQALTIAVKPDGRGSSASGGELLLLALATCYCNDLYREAARRNIKVHRVEVTALGTFPREGAPGEELHYRARVEAEASRADIEALMRHTDEVAEVHETLRRGATVTLQELDAQPVRPA